MKSTPRAALRVTLLIILGVSLFALGLTVGYKNRPDIEKVAGVINITPPPTLAAATETPFELKTCVDAQGKEAPCLLSHAEAMSTSSDVADFDQFWKVWNVINEKYVPTKHKAVSNQEKVWGAIAGLADSLGDPYTYFMPPQEKTLFEQDVSGTFGGVGMQIGAKDGMLTVIAPLKGSPAEKAGIKKGDKILKIDNATTSEMTIDKALYLIRGEIGKAVTLSIFREGVAAPFDVSIVRAVIDVPTIDTEKKGDVFVIHLYSFTETSPQLFKNALRQFVESGSDKLILDLRGNPGGYLEAAVDMASWFLPQGKVVVSEEEKEAKGQVYRSKGYNVFGDKFHFVILVDGGSASAAEILAGALSEQGVATLVGTKTFGKGSVQELVPITPETSLKITIARWITPNGTNLSDGGINPDIKVEITKADVDAGKDPQLDKAIEVVRKLGGLH